MWAQCGPTPRASPRSGTRTSSPMTMSSGQTRRLTPAGAVPYNIDTTFHEPFVLFGFLAALTPLELVSGIVILPQRQTALVAKQAAEVDLLTGGRLRLGVGLGWNEVEYRDARPQFLRSRPPVRGADGRSCAGCGPSGP